MPMMAPIDPPDKVKALAQHLAREVDAYLRKVPLSYSELLQGLEWLRYRVTESLIAKGKA